MTYLRDLLAAVRCLNAGWFTLTVLPKTFRILLGISGNIFFEIPFLLTGVGCGFIAGSVVLLPVFFYIRFVAVRAVNSYSCRGGGEGAL